jgi:hypothetical protein
VWLDCHGCTASRAAMPTSWRNLVKWVLVLAALQALQNTPLQANLVKKGRSSLRARQKRSRVILEHLEDGSTNPCADSALTASTHAICFPFLILLCLPLTRSAFPSYPASEVLGALHGPQLGATPIEID